MKRVLAVIAQKQKGTHDGGTASFVRSARKRSDIEGGEGYSEVMEVYSLQHQYDRRNPRRTGIGVDQTKQDLAEEPEKKAITYSLEEEKNPTRWGIYDVDAFH